MNIKRPLDFHLLALQFVSTDNVEHYLAVYLMRVHCELLPRNELLVAIRASEAGEVENLVFGSHHVIGLSEILVALGAFRTVHPKTYGNFYSHGLFLEGNV